MTTEAQLIKRTKELRELGTQWSEVEKILSEEGFTSPTGKDYAAGTLCKLLLKSYPGMRTKAEYNKGANRSIHARPTRTKRPLSKMRLIQVLMETDLLSANEKVEAIGMITGGM